MNMIITSQVNLMLEGRMNGFCTSFQKDYCKSNTVVRTFDYAKELKEVNKLINKLDSFDTVRLELHSNKTSNYYDKKEVKRVVISLYDIIEFKGQDKNLIQLDKSNVLHDTKEVKKQLKSYFKKYFSDMDYIHNETMIELAK